MHQILDSKKLKNERLKRGMSLAKFADFLRPWAPDISRQAVWTWEKMGVTPRGFALNALSKACKKSITFFFK